MSGSPALVLASGSPRRAAVLRQLALDFEVRPPTLEEEIPSGESPAEAAERLARRKAAAVGRAGDPSRELILAAATVVADGGELLLKPDSAEEARRMLARLAGGEHVVHTGMALAHADRVESARAATRVRFREADREEIARYVETGEPMDKAGGYGIQALGAVLVAGIEGDYFNVMGFPVQTFQELLGRHGWRYAFGCLVSLSERG